MRFALTADQEALRDAVRDVLAKESPPAVVRAAWDAVAAGECPDRGPWEALAAMGVIDALVPEREGGIGLSEVELAPVLEEAGRAAYPFPLVEAAAVAAPLLGAGAVLTAVRSGPDEHEPVPYAAVADRLLLRTSDGLWSVDPTSAQIEPLPAVDRSRGLARVRWRPPSGGELVTDDPGVLDLAFDRGALGTAAVLVGLGQAMLDMTVRYTAERRQFGVPVGSFQAVKHHLADVALAIEFARPAVLRAAWSVANDAPERGRDVSMAKALASDAAVLAGRHALQCHGAIGYTVEHDLHLYLKRAWALARAWGDERFHTDRVARAIGLPSRGDTT